MSLTGYGGAAKAQITRMVGTTTTTLNFSYSSAPNANTIVLSQDGFGFLTQGRQLYLRINLDPTTGAITGGEITRTGLITRYGPTPGVRQSFTCN